MWSVSLFFFSLSFTDASKSIRFYQKASDSTRVQCRSSSYVSVGRMTIAEMNLQSVPIKRLPNNRLTGADLGWGSEAAAAAPFSFSEIFFLSKYTIILSFCKQAVGTFDFFS